MSGSGGTACTADAPLVGPSTRGLRVGTGMAHLRICPGVPTISAFPGRPPRLAAARVVRPGVPLASTRHRLFVPCARADESAKNSVRAVRPDRGYFVTRTRLCLLAIVALFAPMVSVVVPASAAPPPDDAPVLLTPKGDRDTGEDEQGFDKLRDAYYWTRLLAGDDGGINMSQAAALRSKA